MVVVRISYSCQVRLLIDAQHDWTSKKRFGMMKQKVDGKYQWRILTFG